MKPRSSNLPCNLSKLYTNYIPAIGGGTEATTAITDLIKGKIKEYIGKARPALVKDYIKAVCDLPTFGAHLFSGTVGLP
jgi:hypothetical protein